MADNGDGRMGNPDLLGEVYELQTSLVMTVDRMCTGERGAFDDAAATPPPACDALLRAVEPLRALPSRCVEAPLPQQDYGVLMALNLHKPKPDVERKCMFHGMPRSG